jgi:hypothetical protein
MFQQTILKKKKTCNLLKITFKVLVPCNFMLYSMGTRAFNPFVIAIPWLYLFVIFLPFNSKVSSIQVIYLTNRKYFKLEFQKTSLVHLSLAILASTKKREDEMLYQHQKNKNVNHIMNIIVNWWSMVFHFVVANFKLLICIQPRS